MNALIKKKSYRFRLYPSNQVESKFNNLLNSCCYLYNSMLEYERYTYEKNKRFANRNELNNLLPDIKIISPSFKKIHSQVLQNVNDRVIKSFKNFFNRINKNEKAGYPRFKNFDKYNSFTYPQKGFNILSKNKIKLSKIGETTIKFHRSIKGNIKTLTIIRTPTNKWFACFSVQQEIIPPKKQFKKIVGIDLGLEYFATFSNGKVIDNPRWLKRSLKLLKQRSKQLFKKKKDSSNFSKSRLKLARLHEKISNQRIDFLHKLTCNLVNEYDGIALEDLKPSEMKNKYLQFSINDVSWYKFRQVISYKAEEAGVKLDFVNPRNTSKKCSKCGNMVDMPLSKRRYDCCICENSMSRDLNASLNILRKSCFYVKTTEGTSGSNACGIVPLGTTMKQEIPCIIR